MARTVPSWRDGSNRSFGCPLRETKKNQETKNREQTAQDGKDSFREQEWIRGGIEFPVPDWRGIAQLELFHLRRGKGRTWRIGVPSGPRVDRIVGD
ncbi:MAG TPA: hypothetical protein DEV72_15310 [Ktedonobacter sp.]|nr:hypothetical protein [Ktedonobacter sp.]